MIIRDFLQFIHKKLAFFYNYDKMLCDVKHKHVTGCINLIYGGNMNQYFLDAKNKLKKDHNIDVIEDILLNREDRIIAYGDIRDPNHIELFVISGSFTLIGLEDRKSYTLQDIIRLFEYDNAYVEVAGKAEYRAYVNQRLFYFKDDSDVTFPISVNDQKVWIKISSYPILKKPNICTFFISNKSDIMVHEEASYAKTHRDALTGLFNKYTLDYHYGLRYERPNLHVFYCDIDDFKTVNDTDGHKAGDVALMSFANILKSHETEYDRFYRIGGDEFVGLFFVTEEKAKAIAIDILNKTRQIKSKFSQIPLTVSIGVVKAEQREDVIRKADVILYQAKDNGKNQFKYELESNILLAL